ncbi:MAG: SIMPL domain-containing protein [Allorhizobium sp.]|uniref:SIMPL domain-containing protein n=1 Tax=Rhizobium rosettiformans TaxID=1368430 RepID=A0ABX7EZC2_9HYPH|nr:SIMPL domain-containing protein [Rhizobium rosettiformans]QRF53484.1 SIMPL domain-containing protein [Rhizobium rosettiformans]
MLKITRALVMATALSGSVLSTGFVAQAVAAEGQLREATIMVSGEGEAAIAPDMAVISLSVVRDAETAGEALSANSAAMREVLAALKEQGIAEKDVQTTDFSIQPKYKQENRTDGTYEAPVIVGYTVSNGLTVRVRDLAKLGEIIDRSVTLGVNQGGGITFTNDDPETAIEAARKQAVEKAAAKAKTLTEAAGVRIGRIVEISENFARPMPQMYAAAPMAKMADESVPIASGENRYSVTVNITYAIEQ